MNNFTFFRGRRKKYKNKAIVLPFSCQTPTNRAVMIRSYFIACQTLDLEESTCIILLKRIQKLV